MKNIFNFLTKKGKYAGHTYDEMMRRLSLKIEKVNAHILSLPRELRELIQKVCIDNRGIIVHVIETASTENKDKIVYELRKFDETFVEFKNIVKI